MKIALISPYTDITAFGIRTISAYIKKHGYQSRLIFLSDPEEEVTMLRGERYYYPESIVEQTVELCANFDLIGFSLFSMHFDRCRQVTQKLKQKLDIPVIWGGIHPTIRTEDCLEYADIVCVGEGEEAVLELLQRLEQKRDYKDVQNLCFKVDGQLIRNPLRPLIQGLDSLPYPDYDLADDHIIDRKNRRIEPMDIEKMHEILRPGSIAIRRAAIPYQTMTGRGCPNNCTYCCNNTYRGMYKKQRYLRRRSVRNVINELTTVTQRMNFINTIVISDDSFLAAPTKEIQEFARQYKEKIGLPFSCLGDPCAINEDKLAALVDAGLIELQMGIQSASLNTLKLYNRKIAPEKTMEATKIINKFKDKLLPYYDIIIDNPYESEDDMLQTLQFLAQLPNPFRIQAFSLVFFPGTELRQKAIADKLLSAEAEKENSPDKQYFMKKRNYINAVFSLFNKDLPHFVMWILTRRSAVKLLNRPLFNHLISGLSALRQKMALPKTKGTPKHKWQPET